jgi:subtilisin
MPRNPSNQGESSKVKSFDTTVEGSGVPTPPTGRPGGTTGRFLVLLRQDAKSEGVSTIEKRTGKKLARATPTLSALGLESAQRPEGIYFETLGVAVVESPPEEVHGLMVEGAGENGPIMHVEPERYVYALAAPRLVPVPAEEEEPVVPVQPTRFEYLLGYRDAVNHVVEKIIERGSAVDELEGLAVTATVSETQLTWGLQVTRVANSRFTGKGIRVAVLDTGMDLGHPDFAGRTTASQSFVAGQPVQDGHGHGTHCIGTSCGPREPGMLPRYGIAFNAEIFAGKVLNNQGSGTDSQILGGIEWAINNNCAVVSMSLGAPVQLGQPPSQIFEQVARRALEAGTLIIAAAGNDSQRPQDIEPVGHPANCPSIMAVAALDRNLHVSFFSNGGRNPNGGQVDIAAPGRNIRSSWPRPMLYNTISGTSMATPHVAGIAALLAEAHPQARGLALWTLVTQHARHLGSPSRDIGAGLVQAPQ